jgi:CheY-like chemotaxis protein
MNSVEDSTKPILLVEDESGDAELLIRAFKRAGVQNPIRHLDNGDAALFYLRDTDVAAGVIPNPIPILILLDLKLPGMSGLELLRWLRQQKHLRRIPVLVLTAESNDRYMDAAYDGGANSYLLKSPKPEEVERVVKLITNYWLGLNESPLIVSRR